MTRHGNYAQRRARGGKGLLPPNPKQWENEHNGLDLREQLGLRLDVSLPHETAFQLLPDVTVLAHGEIPAAFKYLQHFRDMTNTWTWSGMGLSLPDGGALVFYNDSHSLSRVRSTLMEEFFHLWLEHPPTSIRVYGENGGSRSFESHVEEEAFGSGAAALVPYQPLKTMLTANDSVSKIAAQFEVSRDLVLFRAKVTKLYNRIPRRQPKSR